MENNIFQFFYVLHTLCSRMEDLDSTSDDELNRYNRSIVDILGEYTSSCGYCKSDTGSVSFGLLTKRLLPQDYQDLVDRGWRRCGYMCYKPIMNKTCCPSYTIRCYAPGFKLSKSQKKVVKTMSAFLRSERPLDKKIETSDSIAEDVCTSTSARGLHNKLKDLAQRKKAGGKVPENPDVLQVNIKEAGAVVNLESEDVIANSQDEKTNPLAVVTNVTQGSSLNTQTEFPRKKAKIIRRENKLIKLRKKGLELTSNLQRSKQPTEKTLEDYLQENDSVQTAKNMDAKLFLAASLSPEQCKEEWELYKKYQMTIHRDSENECGYEDFMEFLVRSSLQHSSSQGSPSFGYGSFHQQYRLNGKLIAVGVIDILPKCLSSVYFFYDPDYSHLSLGTYGSLREIAFVRSLSQQCTELRFYYLGYYIHTCDKMRYKKNYSPSFLLCPEAFTWHPVHECLSKIDASKYSRLNDSTGSTEENIDCDKVMCWVSFLDKLMTFQIYQYTSRSLPVLYSSLASAAKTEITEYVQLVGQKCAESMIVVI